MLSLALIVKKPVAPFRRQLTDSFNILEEIGDLGGLSSVVFHRSGKDKQRIQDKVTYRIGNSSWSFNQQLIIGDSSLHFDNSSTINGHIYMES